MGKAGQALRQVLESYNISQSQLAIGLGVERPIVFRWYHEKIDPTAETVADIVKALNKINKLAANDFIQAYLGELALFKNQLTNQDLPLSDKVNVTVLAQIFNNITNSYKHLYFLSILDIIKRRNFDTLSPISFREIIVEMLANAWYPHNYFKLSFGKQDQIANKLDALDLEITEPILKFRDTDKKLLRTSINNQNLDNIVISINRYVSYRLIRPFFSQEMRGLKDYDVDPIIISLANNQFDTKKPLYYFNAEEPKNCNAIILHPDWIEYLEENYTIVRGWASWEWLNYMQQRNPSTPNVVNKLFMPQERDSLANQNKYWKTILEYRDIECIYSKVKLNNQLWNLIPTTKSVNSSKSNSLPSEEYFLDFVTLQHLGLTTYKQSVSQIKWSNDIETFVAELKVDQPDELLNLEILFNAYTKTIKPLISLATLQGFSPNWVYA
ncbi:helix-turn-helix transcriptional regulator [Nostoc sp. UIC 10630]|uniref:helix-turn-helix domain-containing protein n=1 Tax=Nostoc sp. UIC 10630 TaxID=2100146 RepID=UPI00158E97F6|nr:helix-turn-helix transcriptional regulator [Nostoc sp. UIC 10630]